MASAGFFADNRHRSFPFLKGTVNWRDTPVSLRNLPDDCIVDAGFVMGQASAFRDGTHSVWLARIARQGDTFFFAFASDAPGLYADELVFARNRDDPLYITEYAEAGVIPELSQSLEVCDEPGWWGYLVTGSLEELDALLPTDGTIQRGVQGATIEPALIQNLTGTYLSSLAIANADRTRVDTAQGCDAISWPYNTGVLFIQHRCIVGDVILKPGYNLIIRQNTVEGTITLAPSVGAGAGEPCNEVGLFPGEVPPPGSDLLSGGPGCGDVLRSFNGQGGRLFDIKGGLGVIVTSLPEEHKVLIDVNFSGMALCLAPQSESEGQSESSGSGDGNGGGGGGGGDTYVPSLNFADSRNSQYLAIL